MKFWPNTTHWCVCGCVCVCVHSCVSYCYKYVETPHAGHQVKHTQLAWLTELGVLAFWEMETPIHFLKTEQKSIWFQISWETGCVKMGLISWFHRNIVIMIQKEVYRNKRCKVPSLTTLTHFEQRRTVQVLPQGGQGDRVGLQRAPGGRIESVFYFLAVKVGEKKPPLDIFGEFFYAPWLSYFHFGDC